VAIRHVQVFACLLIALRSAVRHRAAAGYHPRFHSTAGNWLGMEVSPATQTIQKKTIFEQLFY
jgi:hypothetical protein